MKEENLESELGNLEAATSFLSRKWQPLIVFTLSEKGETGFNELKDFLTNVSGKVLSENLDDLVSEGFVDKVVLSENPKRVKYSLTEKGSELIPLLNEMLEWAEGDDLTVLVVEDEESLANLYVEWLSSKYNVLKAVSGNEALKRVDEEVDLVVLDRELPDSSGEQVSDKIDNVYDCSIMFTTAHDPEVDIIDMSVDEYLIKPVSKDELLDTASKIIERKELTDMEKRLHSLEAKKEVLEEEKNISLLEEREEYKRLLDKISELRDKV